MEGNAWVKSKRTRIVTRPLSVDDLMLSYTLTRAVVVLWAGRKPDWYLSINWLFVRCWSAWWYAAFSNILDATHIILMGLRSDPVVGLAILGMGVTRALVHISGKRELLRDKLTISWRAGITAYLNAISPYWFNNALVHQASSWVKSLFWRANTLLYAGVDLLNLFSW